jgi:TMEM175 potassium channel family protein
VGSRWGTSRIEAFSDGVFAIAITLLILEVGVPESEFDNLWRGIGHQWPSYLAYVTSFITIGGLWMAHHGTFRRLQYADAMVMRLNLLLLMAVSFLPFPTGLMAEAIRDTDAERAAVVFYGLTLFSISILLRVLWGGILRHPDLLNPDVSEQEIKAIRRAATPNIGFYAAVIVLSVLVPKVAVFGYLVIAIAAVWRARGDESPQPGRAEVA